MVVLVVGVAGGGGRAGGDRTMGTIVVAMMMDALVARSRVCHVVGVRNRHVDRLGRR